MNLEQMSTEELREKRDWLQSKVKHGPEIHCCACDMTRICISDYDSILSRRENSDNEEKKSDDDS